jgi:hypothetical protein
MAADMHLLTDPTFVKTRVGSSSLAPPGLVELSCQITLATANFDEVGDIIPLFKAPPFFNPSQVLIVSTDLDSGGPTLVSSLVLTDSVDATFAAKTDYNVLTGLTIGQAAGVYDSAAQAYATQALLDLKYVPNDRVLWFAWKITTAPTTPAAGTMIWRVRGQVLSIKKPLLTPYT